MSLRDLAVLALAIATSWVVAAAGLAAVLPLVPVTAGDRPDHLE